MTANALPSTTLTRGLLFTFALPGILQAFMQAPAVSLLQGIYAKETTIGLMALGGAVFAVRMVDIFTDLLIGYFSDFTAQRGVSRKLWMGAGTILAVVAIWFLFRPPANVGVTYYGAWLLAANIGWSLIEIPYRSWSLEFSPAPADRTRIVTWIAFLGVIGGAMFYIVAPLGKAAGLLPTADLNLASLGLTAIVVVMLLPALNFFALLRIPDGEAKAPDHAPAPPRESTRLLLASVLGNVPFLRLISCFVIYSFMTGVSQGVTFLYFTNYLQLGSQVNTVLGLAIPFSLLGVPVWGLIVQRYPRQKVWAVGMGLTGVCFFSFGLMQPHTNIVVLALLYCTAAFCLLSTVVTAPVILGDIIDYGKENYGVDRAGLYTSVQGQVLKGVGAASAAAGLVLLGWAEFDPTKSGDDLTPQAILALKWIVSWGPALGLITTAVMLWFVPISREAREQAEAAKRLRQAA